VILDWRDAGALQAGQLTEHLGGEHVGALLKDEDWYP
jgi:hypothetical protein